MGPNEVMVARTGMPLPSPPRARNSTGKVLPDQAWPMLSVRAMSFSLPVAAVASPERSPLISARNTGTPGGGELLGHHVQRDGLARAGRAGHQAVPVHHRQRQPDRGILVEFAVDDRGSELDRGALQGVALLDGGDFVCSGFDGHADSLAGRACPRTGDDQTKYPKIVLYRNAC